MTRTLKQIRMETITVHPWGRPPFQPSWGYYWYLNLSKLREDFPIKWVFQSTWNTISLWRIYLSMKCIMKNLTSETLPRFPSMRKTLGRKVIRLWTRRQKWIGYFMYAEKVKLRPTTLNFKTDIWLGGHLHWYFISLDIFLFKYYKYTNTLWKGRFFFKRTLKSFAESEDNWAFTIEVQMWEQKLVEGNH